MNNFELLEYMEFPEDEYTKAICQLRIDGKYIASFAYMKSKDGGMFWTSPSCGANKNGKKEYFKGFKLDSDFENQKLLKWLNSVQDAKKTCTRSFDIPDFS